MNSFGQGRTGWCGVLNESVSGVSPIDRILKQYILICIDEIEILAEKNEDPKLLAFRQLHPLHLTFIICIVIVHHVSRLLFSQIIYECPSVHFIALQPALARRVAHRMQQTIQTKWFFLFIISQHPVIRQCIYSLKIRLLPRFGSGLERLARQQHILCIQLRPRLSQTHSAIQPYRIHYKCPAESHRYIFAFFSFFLSNNVI